MQSLVARKGDLFINAVRPKIRIHPSDGRWPRVEPREDECGEKEKKKRGRPTPVPDQHCLFVSAGGVGSMRPAFYLHGSQQGARHLKC